jgi:hypothetical protein
MVAKNRYIVNITDQSRFDELLEQSKAPTNRIEAATHALQSSHYIACDSAYMLCFPVSSSRVLLPVACVRSQALPMQFRPAKYAVLIENQDCFFDWQLLMRHFASSVNVSECDIYFAGGKRILNPAMAQFLKQYETLYCAFDYDLDGLKMACSLITKQYAITHVLIPDRLTELSGLFTFKPASTERFLESLKQCEQMNLPDLRQVISTTQHFMEQEALLSVSKPS